MVLVGGGMALPGVVQWAGTVFAWPLHAPRIEYVVLDVSIDWCVEASPGGVRMKTGQNWWERNSSVRLGEDSTSGRRVANGLRAASPNVRYRYIDVRSWLPWSDMNGGNLQNILGDAFGFPQSPTATTTPELATELSLEAATTPATAFMWYPACAGPVVGLDTWHPGAQGNCIELSKYKGKAVTAPILSPPKLFEPYFVSPSGATKFVAKQVGGYFSFPIYEPVKIVSFDVCYAYLYSTPALAAVFELLVSNWPPLPDPTQKTHLLTTNADIDKVLADDGTGENAVIASSSAVFTPGHTIPEGASAFIRVRRAHGFQDGIQEFGVLGMRVGYVA